MVNCLFCEIVSVAGRLFGLAGICMWAKHSRTKLSKTQAGLHPFSPSVESWSCVALPLVRRVARHGVWHVSGANPRLFATRRPKPTLTPPALSPCPRPRPRPPWPHGHHYPTTTPPRSNDDHNLSTYYPSLPSPLVGLKVVGAPWRREFVEGVSPFDITSATAPL